MQVGQQEMQVCDSYTIPRWRSRCYQESTGASMWLWCLSLWVALDGTPWQETTSGSNIVFAKQMWEALMGHDSFISMMHQVVPMMRPYFRCQ